MAFAKLSISVTARRTNPFIPKVSKQCYVSVIYLFLKCRRYLHIIVSNSFKHDEECMKMTAYMIISSTDPRSQNKLYMGLKGNFKDELGESCA